MGRGVALALCALAVAAGCYGSRTAYEEARDQAEKDLGCKEVAVRPAPGYLPTSSNGEPDVQDVVAGGCGRVAQYHCTRGFTNSWTCRRQCGPNPCDQNTEPAPSAPDPFYPGKKPGASSSSSAAPDHF